MVNKPDRRNVVAGLGAVTAGLGFSMARGKAQTMSEAPDIVFLDGRITTLDRANPQAQAVAVRASRFVAVADERSVMALAGPCSRRASNLKSTP